MILSCRCDKRGHGGDGKATLALRDAPWAFLGMAGVTRGEVVHSFYRTKEGHGTGSTGRALWRRTQALWARGWRRAARGGEPLRAGRRPAPGYRQAREGRRGRPALPDAAGCHGLGQDLHHGQDHRGRAAPHAHHGAQQDAGRAGGERDEGALSQQRRGLLRELLRLLPARGLRAADRHLHREGRLHQRGGREAAPPGHLESPLAPRRHCGGLGLLHLRHRQPAGLRGPGAHGEQGRATRARRPHPRPH